LESCDEEGRKSIRTPRDEHKGEVGDDANVINRERSHKNEGENERDVTETGRFKKRAVIVHQTTLFCKENGAQAREEVLSTADVVVKTVEETTSVVLNKTLTFTEERGGRMVISMLTVLVGDLETTRAEIEDDVRFV